jgi:uncharacterized integral membrane protein
MTTEEIAQAAARLKAIVPEQEAYFGIFQYGEGSDESFIRANKQGLVLFAAEILRASAHVDDTIAHETQTIIPLKFDEAEWLDGDTLIDYIEPVKHAPAAATPQPAAGFTWPVIASGVVVGIYLLILLVQEVGSIATNFFK